MAWLCQALQIADKLGQPTGRWRMTAKSDEGGGGPYGDQSHDHASSKEAEECELCDKYISGITGFPSKKEVENIKEERDRAEYDRLKIKFS